MAKIKVGWLPSLINGKLEKIYAYSHAKFCAYGDPANGENVQGKIDELNSQLEGKLSTSGGSFTEGGAISANGNLFINVEGYGWLSEVLKNKQDKMIFPLYMINSELEDWNAIDKPGIFSANSNNAKNIPSNSSGLWVNAIVVPTNGKTNFLSLIAWCRTGIWSRDMENGVWSQWIRLI